jgi:hypothetical protein
VAGKYCDGAGLVLVTGQAFHIHHIRAGRTSGPDAPTSGAVRAAVAVGRAEASGDRIGSLDLEFQPNTIKTGKFEFDVWFGRQRRVGAPDYLPALILGPGSPKCSYRAARTTPWRRLSTFCARRCCRC